MAKRFTEMLEYDLQLLSDLTTKTREVVATERGISVHTLNEQIYRIRARYHRYNKYINPIRNTLGKAQHLKRVFMKTQPDIMNDW